MGWYFSNGMNKRSLIVERISEWENKQQSIKDNSAYYHTFKYDHLFIYFQASS